MLCKFEPLVSRRVTWITTLTAVALTTGCGGPTIPEGCSPIADLRAQGTCPVVVESVSAMLSPMQRMFRVRVKNISDADIVGLAATAVLTRGKDHVGPAVHQEVGQMDPIQPLLPGETADWTFIAEDPEAVHARMVIRQVMYRAEVAGGYILTMKMDNPHFKAELGGPDVVP